MESYHIQAERLWELSFGGHFADGPLEKMKRKEQIDCSL
jgi:hypothetical protein